MKSVFVNEKTLDGAWFALLSELYKHGRNNHIDAGSFAGANRLEFDYAAGTIEFPTTRPLAPIMPDGVPPVTTEEAIESYFANYIMDGENLAKNEHYRYATFINGGEYHLPYVEYKTRALYRFGIQHDKEFIVRVPSQVQWLINHYKKAGLGNNHCYIQVGYPESSLGYDMPYTSEADRQTSPCLRGIDTAVKDNALHMSVVFRSWDLYAGFPENMGGITMLGEYIANELGITMGPLSFACLKLHCYDFQIEAVKARLKV
jgi:thymidylate synthase